MRATMTGTPEGLKSKTALRFCARGISGGRSDHLAFFFSPKDTGLAAPELAVDKTLAFSCFGFLISLLPRLLSPFPMMISHVI